ncbi:MAG: hemerythrin domain-containing protein [Candidatus Electrothrix aestuarii]|uniref:Hemerythrin domain-containing protein n=1 Tax=Candidatus Electrothrix aestuarii TaxID=3062594 RepID=A0AAU8LYK2_9BACT|nr:hemerythrin domain-containing protein [Candidatus Electrothrix aestuarii]
MRYKKAYPNAGAKYFSPLFPEGALHENEQNQNVMTDIKMDKLTKAYLDHGMISEEMTFFEKFVEGIDADEVEDYLVRIRKFSDEYIVNHFRFEEEEIFPLILKYGNEKEKKMVQMLKNDHVKILQKLDDFLKKVTSYGTHPSEEEIEEIMHSSRELLEMVLLHARKEDAHLFPNL